MAAFAAAMFLAWRASFVAFASAIFCFVAATAAMWAATFWAVTTSAAADSAAMVVGAAIFFVAIP